VVGVPVTVLAHQAPLFPLRRWIALDGVAFVAGSIAPDLSAATLNTAPHYILWGVPIWHDGHRWGEQLQWCLPVGLLIAVLVRRLLAPTLAPHLPTAGAWHLPDLAALGERRYRWWVIAASVLAGSITHVLLDGITHEDRAGSLSVGALGTPLLQVGGRTLTLGIVAQVLVSAVLCVVAYRGFRASAAGRWGATGRPAPPGASQGWPRGADRLVLLALLAGFAVAAGLALTQAERGLKIVAMTWVWLALAVAVAVALGVRAGRWRRRRVPSPAA
jgi:hypothetical protein